MKNITEICDLHVHSNNSDGTYSVKELIKHAENENIKVLALCDHNTIKGLDDLKKYSKTSNVITIPGIEITTSYKNKEVHVLGLFIKEEYYKEITDYVEIINIRKEESNKELAKKLAEDGYEINYEDIKSSFKCEHPNRMHFAKKLLEKGYVQSIKDAMNTLLKDNGKYYKSSKKLDTLEVIEFLSKVKAVPVIAHPLLNLNKEELEELLPLAKEKGLIAIETIYPLYSEEDSIIANNLKTKYHLLDSGGSDFHGSNKPDIKLGVGKNNIKVPYEIYEKLNKYSK